MDHSRAPWEAIPMDGRGGYKILSAPEGDRARIVISEWSGAHDAFLVAAAPDLLAACKAALDLVQPCSSAFCAADGHRTCRYGMMKSAIAKAEGK